MFFDNGHLFRSRIFQNADGTRLDPIDALKRRIQGKGIKKEFPILVLDLQEFIENNLAVFLLFGKAHRMERNLVRGPVAHEHVAVAVVNVAALGCKHHLTQAVVFGTLEVFLVMRELQRVEPDDQHQEQQAYAREEHDNMPVPALYRLVVLIVI